MSLEICPFLKKHIVSINKINEYKKELEELYSYLLKPYIPIWGEEPISEKEILNELIRILNILKRMENDISKKNICFRKILDTLQDNNYSKDLIQKSKSFFDFNKIIELEKKHFDKLKDNEKKIHFINEQIMNNTSKINLMNSIFIEYKFKKIIDF